MRIAHVVSYLSTTGAYGGPASVAAGHCRKLQNLGFDVVLYAGWDGVGDGEVVGVHTRSRRARRLIPSDSFGLLCSPRLLAAFAREVRSYDVVHVHLARDLVSLPLALVCLVAGVPLVIQTHGMIVPDRRVLCRLLDALAVRTVFRRAQRHLVLTELEREQVEAIVPRRSNVTRIGNGVEVGSSAVASWPREGAVPEVIFCSRLHPRKRAPAFVEMAAELLARGVVARFSIVGPDGGDLARVQEMIAHCDLAHAVRYEGSLPASKIMARLADAHVFVLPSVDEPFPMAALEAISVALPAVITESNGLADDFRHADDRFVATPDHRRLADAVQRIIADGSAWVLASEAAAALVSQRFSLNSVVEELLEVYRTAAA